MRRHSIGLIALLLLLGAAVYWIFPPESAANRQLEAACWRVGTLMLVLWIAYPQVDRAPHWIWTILPILVLTLALRPKWFLVAVPIVIVLAILKPRFGTRKGN